MKISIQKSIILCSVLCCISVNKMIAQEKNVVVTQDSKFEQLLNEKRKINASITNSNRYKIQIYNGDSETSKKTLVDFKKNNPDLDGTIVFNTPIYKVWIGNFRTRIEVEKNLIAMRKKFPNAFVIKPNK